jgi:hypothetical protein
VHLRGRPVSTIGERPDRQRSGDAVDDAAGDARRGFSMRIDEVGRRTADARRTSRG